MNDEGLFRVLKGPSHTSPTWVRTLALPSEYQVCTMEGTPVRRASALSPFMVKSREDPNFTFVTRGVVKSIARLVRLLHRVRTWRCFKAVKASDVGTFALRGVPTRCYYQGPTGELYLRCDWSNRGNRVSCRHHTTPRCHGHFYFDGWNHRVNYASLVEMHGAKGCLAKICAVLASQHPGRVVYGCKQCRFVFAAEPPERHYYGDPNSDDDLVGLSGED